MLPSPRTVRARLRLSDRIQKLRRPFALATTFALLLGGALGGVAVSSASAADATAVLTISKTTDTAEVHPDENFVWEIAVGCESLDTICVDAVLQDTVPSEFVVTDVRVIGTDNSPIVDLNGNALTVTFTETSSRFPNVRGMWDGQKLSVLVSAKLKTDTPAARDGDTVTNTATAEGSNAARVSSDSTVTLRVPPKVAVLTTKSWAPTEQVAGDPTSSTMSIAASNTSNIPADTLTLTEPAAGFTPFTSMQFVGFGAVTFPAGANLVTMTVITGATQTVVPAAATLVFPVGVDPGDVTGFIFQFSSSAGNGKILPSGAGGTAGSVVLTVAQRASVSTTSTTSVLNRVLGSVVTSGGTASATADATFTIKKQTSVVTATKSFTPATVDQGQNSVVLVGAKNDSNTPFTTLTITEPAPGEKDLDENGLAFVGFGEAGGGALNTGTTKGSWPSGATSATVTYLYSTGAGASAVVTGLTGWPTPLAGETVLGFTVVYSGAAIVPGASATVPFVVKTSTSTPASVTNKVQATATGPAGTPTPSVASAPLTVKAIAITSTISKAFNAPSGANTAGQEFLVTLKSTPSGNTPIKQLTLEDSTSTAFWNAFTATKLTAMTVPSYATLTVRYWDGAAWQDVPGAVNVASSSAVEVTLPTGAQGLRFVYTAKTAAGLTLGTEISAKFVVHLGATQATTSLQNCATSSVTDFGTLTGGSAAPNCKSVSLTGPGGGAVTPLIDLDTTKAWGTSPLLIPTDPSVARPSTTLTVTVKNTSPITATQLTLEEPSAGTTPFEQLNLTKLTSISTPSGTNNTLTTVTIKATDGTVIYSATGAAAISGATALTALQLANAAYFTVTVGGSFANGATLTVNATTQLRAATRTGGIPITDALTIGNTVRGTISDGTTTRTEDAPKDLPVLKEADAPLGATLTKTITASSGTIYTQTPRIVKLKLSIAKTAGDPVKFEIVDTTPTFWNAFRMTGAITLTNPSGSSNPNITARIDYFSGATFGVTAGQVMVSGGSWTNGTAFTLPGNTVAVASANLPAIIPAEVQGVRVSFISSNGTILGSNAFAAEFETATLTTLRSGGPVTDTLAPPMPSETANGVVTNTATAKVSNATKTADVVEQTATFTFIPGTATVTLSKTPKINSLVPGEEVAFKLVVKNTGSTAIVNPVFTDVIPHDSIDQLLVYDPVKNTPASFAVTPTSTTITTDPNKITLVTKDAQKPGTTAESDQLTTLTFTFPSGTILLPGQEYTITLPLKVRAGVERDTVFLNTFAFSADGGLTGTTTASVKVLEGGSYWRTKDVQEDLAPGQSPTGLYNILDKTDVCVTDGGFYRVPCVVKTQPGGTETWRLRVTNTGNLSTQTLTMVDVFPYPGDTGASNLLSSIKRGSTWTPTFLGNLDFFDQPAGTTTTVWYQTAAEERCTMGNQPNSADPFGAHCDEWLSVAPADLSTVTAIKVKYDFATPLAPGDSVGLTYQTRTPVKLPTGVDPYLANGTPAPSWDSFVVFTTTIKGGGILDYETLEPNKAGIAFATPVAVGDYVWVDKDRDGIQDSGEPGLPDVTVTLHAKGGTVVDTTTTDADGYYLFDKLDAGDYYVTFELTAAQKLKYSFTFQKQGADAAADSNPDRTSGQTDLFRLDAPSAASNMIAAANYTRHAITADYINPTIDAGVIAASVAVGDYVWFDTNKDGIQGAQADVLDVDGVTVLTKGEPGIAGVVLKITGPDGKPVTDVYGSAVGPATTDAKGYYWFGDLPVLATGESYRVTIDQKASVAAIGLFFPTLPQQGADRAKDSSTNFALSGDLVADKAVDATLDFGFYEPTLPTLSLPPDLPTLAFTGTVLAPAVGLVGLLLGGGLTLLLVARSRRPSSARH